MIEGLEALLMRMLQRVDSTFEVPFSKSYDRGSLTPPTICDLEFFKFFFFFF